MANKIARFFASIKSGEPSKDAKRTKTINIILSIVLAVVLWAYVIGEVNPATEKTIVGVPLTVSGVDTLAKEDLVVLTEFSDTVTAVVKGKRNDVYSLTAEKLSARIDLSGCVEGENQVSIKVTAPSNVAEATAKDGNLVVVVDKVVEEQKRVEIAMKGEAGSGSSVEISSISSEKVKVSGPSTYVAKVDSVVGILNIREDQSNYKQTVSLTAVDKDGNTVSGVEVETPEVTVEAYKTATKGISVNLTTSGQSPEGVTLTLPEKVSLSIEGKYDTIRNIQSLDAEALDISDITEDTSVKIAVKLPEGVSAAENSGVEMSLEAENTVLIEIQIKVSKEETESTETTEEESVQEVE